MFDRRDRRRIHTIAALCFIFFLNPNLAWSTPIEEAKASRTLAKNGDFNAAIALSKKAAFQMEKKPGRYSSFLPYVYDDLASLHYKTGKLDEAEHYAAKAQEKIELLVSNKSQTRFGLAHITNTRATIAMARGEFRQAEVLYRSSYDIYKSSDQHRQQQVSVANNLANYYLEIADTTNAETLLLENIQVLQAKTGKRSNTEKLVEQYIKLTRLSMQRNQREELYRYLNQARRISKNDDKVKPKVTLLIAQVEIYDGDLISANRRLEDLTTSLENRITAMSIEEQLLAASSNFSLGNLLVLQGKLVEARPRYKKALELYRKRLHANHPAIARTIHGLAIVNKNLGFYGESEKLYQRAIEISKNTLGEEHPKLASSRLEYALLLSHMGRIADAKAQAKQAIEMLERHPDQELRKGLAYSALGFAHLAEENFIQAQQVFESGTTLIRQTRGDNSVDLPPGLIRLAEIHLAKGETEQAKSYINDAIEQLKRMGAYTPYGFIKALSVQADIFKREKEYEKAREVSTRYFGLLSDRLEIYSNSYINFALHEQKEVRPLFKAHIDHVIEAEKAATSNFLIFLIEKILDWISSIFNGMPGNKDAIGKETLRDLFEVAQYPHMSSTSASIKQMSARLKVQKNIADLLRNRENLVETWMTAEYNEIDAMAGESHKGADSATTSTKIIEQKIKAVDDKLFSAAPELAALIHPKPISLAEIQNLLDEDEALIIQLTEHNGSSVFYVDKYKINYQSTSLNTKQLTHAVDSIRHTVDLSRPDITYSNMPLFDTASAFLIYEKLFLPFEEEISRKRHIIFVPDRALQNLPPHLLLKKPFEVNPDHEIDYKALEFFGLSTAISIIPSPRALASLRQIQASTSSRAPFLGIGDPNLDSGKSTTRGEALTMALVEDELFNKKNPSILRSVFQSLPKTKTELTYISEILKSDPGDLLFGDQATESHVKALQLDKYQNVAFATHGLLAGEFNGLIEPALVLTPPEVATSTDDGLLMSSEIANLKFDAEWIILSACNTAGPDGRPGAEGLSGLAKSFFYAGARALLVSHWSIDSDSAAFLTTSMLKHASSTEHARKRKAEALMLAMRALSNQPQRHFAHPAFWAPFTVVGQGGYL